MTIAVDMGRKATKNNKQNTDRVLLTQIESDMVRHRGYAVNLPELYTFRIIILYRT